MLSYKEYKLLNESLYGAFNLGIRNPATVGGIISGSSVNGTEAALEAESEAALEESKKKKKMDCGSEEPEEEEKDVEENDMEDSEEEEEGDEESEDEDEEDEDEDEDEDEEEEDKEEPKFMKKKAKKEWVEVMSDLEEVLEGVSDDSAKDEIRKGLELIKEGIKKGKNKGHKKGCDCNFCKSMNANKEEKDGEGLTDAQKKLPKGLRDVIAKKGEDEGDKKKCGAKYMKKGCGAKYMNEDDQKWWDSVNGMINANPDQKSWDGWSEVGEVQQAVREHLETPHLSSMLARSRRFTSDGSFEKRDDEKGEYGDTGDSSYPYHGKFTYDHYYGKKLDDSNPEDRAKWEQLSQNARRAFEDMQRFLEAHTMSSGKTEFMKIWDEFAGKLAHLGINLSAQNSPYKR